MYMCLGLKEWRWMTYWIVVFAVNAAAIYVVWGVYYASIGAMLLHPFITSFKESYRSEDEWSKFETEFYKHKTMSWKTKHLVKSYFISALLVILMICNLYGTIEWEEAKKYLLSLVIPVVTHLVIHIIEFNINKKHK